jgi:hypothetical protein
MTQDNSTGRTKPTWLTDDEWREHLARYPDEAARVAVPAPELNGDPDDLAKLIRRTVYHLNTQSPNGTRAYSVADCEHIIGRLKSALGV